MKILQVITSLNIGGAETLLSEITPLLRAKGHTVDICAIDGAETSLKKRLEASGITVYSFDQNCNVYNVSFMFKLAKLMKGYDIVHTHNTASQYFAAFGSMFHNCKMVTTEHSTSNRRRKYKFFKYLDKWMYSQYDRIICISEPCYDSLREHIGDTFPLLTIKNGVNIRKFMEASPIDLGFGRCKIITMVAGFRYEKDQPTLIKSLHYLPVDYHVVLVGDGEKRPDLEAFVKEEKLENRVHMLGIRSDVPQILKSSDIVVMSSHREGLSLSNVEGMCSGHPFIASDVEGLREVTKGYGLLFEHGNPKILATNIKRLLTDNCLYKEVSDKCIKRASEYDINKMVDQYDSLYKTLMANC